jgi:hypothetical protein
MYAYRNRRYEKEMGTPMCEREGEQKVVKNSKQKTQIQAHHKIAESATQTHTVAQTQTKDYVHGI